LRRVSLGYMRIKEVLGLMRVEVVPLSREEALAILKGERSAGKGEGFTKGEVQR
jgi:hypothetical protein